MPTKAKVCKRCEQPEVEATMLLMENGSLRQERDQLEQLLKATGKHFDIAVREREAMEEIEALQ